LLEISEYDFPGVDPQGLKDTKAVATPNLGNLGRLLWRTNVNVRSVLLLWVRTPGGEVRIRLPADNLRQVRAVRIHDPKAPLYLAEIRGPLEDYFCAVRRPPGLFETSVAGVLDEAALELLRRELI
jgi:hypothetical protein